MKPSWFNSLELEGTSWRLARGELTRAMLEGAELPLVTAVITQPAATAPPPQARPVAAPVEIEQPQECTNPACADAFNRAAEEGSPLIERGTEGC